MSPLRTTFCLMYVFISQSFCYVFDINYSYVYSTNKSTYTTAFLQRQPVPIQGFRLVAGAPKNDKISICNATNCQSFLSANNKAGFEMFGAAISGGDTVGDPTFVCSPRFITTQQYRTNGRCFALHKNFKPIHSLDNVYQQVQIYNSTYEFYFAHGQSGFSIKYVGNNEFLLGAPGVLAWKGTVIKHTSFDSKDILYPENKIGRDSYLGYSIEYGTFTFGTRETRCVIAGAPRGDDLLGQVFIFDYQYIHEIILKILKGDQISSYYGASLLATQQHLLVGAPMYTTKSYEEGCVFVYLNTQDDLVFWEKLCGRQKGGRFGTAMTNIGILDDENKRIGVAVSAPYADEGVGIVYIYIETDSGFKEVQRILGRTISTTTRGFGIGLSNGLDIDANDYNDFAVTSLFSDLLIVLRSRKILRFKAYIMPDVNKIRTSTKSVTLNYCFLYGGRLSATDDLSLNVSLESDGRVLVRNSSRVLEAKISQKICENFTLILKTDAFDSPLPLKIKISNKLRECPECPVAYPKETGVSHEIPFVTGCGEENICVPDLQLQAEFENVSQLVLGSRDTVSLTVLVSNLGETAFLCKMNVTTIVAEIRQFPPACSKAENTLHCDISNRLLGNETKQLEFQFDVTRLDPRLRELKIDINVNSAGFGNGSSAKLTATLPVVLKSAVTLIGFSNPDYFETREGLNFTHEYLVFNNGPSPILEKLFEFQIPESITTATGGTLDVFTIIPLADECIPVYEPLPRKARRDLTNLEQMLMGLPQNIKYLIDCKNNTLIKCRTYFCIIGELNANTSSKFRFRIEVKTSLMFEALSEQIQGKSLFLIESLASNLESSTKHQYAVARTVLFRKVTETINIWMWIIIAVIGSIIILLIIVGILYKLNFFARPMKKRLLTEEANINERQCMIVSDDNCEESSEVFNDITF